MKKITTLIVVAGTSLAGTAFAQGLTIRHPVGLDSNRYFFCQEAASAAVVGVAEAVSKNIPFDKYFGMDATDKRRAAAFKLAPLAVDMLEITPKTPNQANEVAKFLTGVCYASKWTTERERNQS